MVVIWQEEAREDLKEYSRKSRMQTTEKIQNYISDLIEYVDLLGNNPCMGKLFYTYRNIDVRQLLFKMHRIIYHIENDEIIIVKIIHTSRDIDNVIKYFNRFC